MAHIVLVHGALLDGSSWGEVIFTLQRSGHTVVAVQLPLTGIQQDAAVVRREIDRMPSPCIVVGHSYGGAVVCEAARAAPNVKALVFVTAFVPDEGERVADLMARYPQPAGFEPYIVPDDDGTFTVDRAHFPRVVAPDVDPVTAQIMATAQGPTANTAFSADTVGRPAWKDVRSYYVLADSDQVVHPATQRWMAERIDAVTATLAGAGHVPMQSQPDEVAALIERAANPPITGWPLQRPPNEDPASGGGS
ncbi:MAG: alpha/beta fold hydrolase [Thermoleophilaceae bacterium]